MDTNYEMEYKNYTENIANTLKSLENGVEVINTPVVPASEKLRIAGNNLYIDKDGKLKVQPMGFEKSLNRHFAEFAKTESKEDARADVFATSFVQGA